MENINETIIMASNVIDGNGIEITKSLTDLSTIPSINELLYSFLLYLNTVIEVLGLFFIITCYYICVACRMYARKNGYYGVTDLIKDSIKGAIDGKTETKELAKPWFNGTKEEKKDGKKQ